MPKLHHAMWLAILLNMAASKSVPVVFRHFEVPENVDGNFKAKCKHCYTWAESICNCNWNTYTVFVIVFKIRSCKQYLYLYLLFCKVFVFVIKYFCVVFDPSLLWTIHCHIFTSPWSGIVDLTSIRMMWCEVLISLGARWIYDIPSPHAKFFWSFFLQEQWVSVSWIVKTCVLIKLCL